MHIETFAPRILLAGMLIFSASTAAANEIGSVVATTGGVEVRRASAGDWKAVTRGAPLYANDEIRSDGRGKAKLFFGDQSVIDIGNATEIAIKRYDTASSNSIIGLKAGRLRAFLSSEMRAADAFEVETPTAVVRTSGTVFLVEYDPDQQATHLHAVDGVVDVQGAIGLIGPSLKVSAGQSTRVREGKFPEPAVTTSAETMALALANLEIIGTGGEDGYAATHPLLTGAITRSDERPAAIATSAVSSPSGGVSYLAPIAPGETLLHRLSPAARANTQPIPEYQFLNPRGESLDQQRRR